MNICENHKDCALLDVVAQYKDEHHEPTPSVGFEVHKRQWYAEQDAMLSEGDMLEYDGPAMGYH